MKTTAKFLMLSLLIGVFTTFYSCSDDDDPGETDPNVICDEAACAADGATKQLCIDFYNDCIANNPDKNADECRIGAVAICK
jgi:hypothetical protein